MKTVLALLLIAAAGLSWVLATRGERSFAAPATEESPVAPAPTVLVHGAGPGQVERAFDVAGMCCTNCTGKLHRVLVAVPGVREAAVDFESGTALVVVDEGADEAAVQAALAFGKYSATLRQTP
ncbi:MAG TPA: heavy metal-associated domain-containing protein [Planctomycetota bacterium]|nr:heavy metal-associated domain-containing protein [Planctomycetota bacterium]